jgi:hypothetical protein
VIYVIAERSDTSVVKIGFTATGDIVSEKAAQGRLSGLQVGTWRELTIVAMCHGTREEEQALHREFREQWIRGEWFANAGPVSTWLGGLSLVTMHGPVQNKPAPPAMCRHCRSVDHQSARCSLPIRTAALQRQIDELTKQNESLRLKMATDAGLYRQLKNAERNNKKLEQKNETLERRAANNNTHTIEHTQETRASIRADLQDLLLPLPIDRPLTERQRDILGFIMGRCQIGDPPTMRQIGERFGIASTNGVSDHLKSLARKGALIKTGAKYTPAPSPARANPFDVASRGLLVGRR